MDFGGGNEIRFERIGRAGIVTLTRPQALNAVTHRMITALARALDAWEADDAVCAVLIRGEGRAFSAGGDIAQIYEAGRAGNPPVAFFADEYRLNARIARFAKPYVALIDGIVMGGGVGVSFHGSHRLMTENAQFAMPEVGIGFFPDVGGSHLLAPLGGFGMYLGLTGERIRHGDAVGCGLATHAVKATDQAALVEELARSGDPDAVLRGLSMNVPREIDAAVLDRIETHFSADTLEEVVASLERTAPADDFAARTLATLGSRSPTSLHVAFRQISNGRGLSMDECMKMEFRILNRMLAGHDFYEGIRAAIIDKDRKPAWRPAGLGEVAGADIDAYFAPLGSKELVL